jgi:hypothetical protein
MPQTGNFPDDIDLLIQNVARLFAHEGDAKLVSILAYATISADQTGYDNWDGGTYTYSVYLAVPQAIYLEVNSELEEIAKKISEKLSQFMHPYANTWLGHIVISPQLV